MSASEAKIVAPAVLPDAPPPPPSLRFKLFPKLPREVRTMIWIQAIPQQLVAPRMVGSTWAPRPPVIARVCSESRVVALKCGQPYAIDKYEKRPSSCWYTPSRDVVLFPLNHGPKSCDHPIFDAELWRTSSMNSIVVQDIWTGSSSISKRTIQRAIEYAVNRPSITEIMVWPCNTKYARRWIGTDAPLEGSEAIGWSREACDKLFGGDMVKIVNLRCQNEVNSVKAIMSMDDQMLSSIRMISWAHMKFDGLVDTRPHEDYWDNLIVECKINWLKAHFNKVQGSKQDKSDNRVFDATPVEVMKPDDIDLQNYWICKTLAKMPSLRPVAILARCHPDNYMREKPSFMPQESWHRSQRSKTESAPTIIFNEEFKLWQKKQQDKKAKGTKKRTVANKNT